MVLKNIIGELFFILIKIALIPLFFPLMVFYSIKITLGTLDKSFRYHNPIWSFIVILLTGILSFGLFFLSIFIGIVINWFSIAVFLFLNIKTLKELFYSFFILSMNHIIYLEDMDAKEFLSLLSGLISSLSEENKNEYRKNFLIILMIVLSVLNNLLFFII
jgi:hypothetical protein